MKIIYVMSLIVYDNKINSYVNWLTTQRILAWRTPRRMCTMCPKKRLRVYMYIVYISLTKPTMSYILFFFPPPRSFLYTTCRLQNTPYHSGPWEIVPKARHLFTQYNNILYIKIIKKKTENVTTIFLLNTVNSVHNNNWSD